MLNLDRSLPDSPPRLPLRWYACGACGRLSPVGSERPGRGRNFGEHPDHEYALCGHSLEWFGRHVMVAIGALP